MLLSHIHHKLIVLSCMLLFGVVLWATPVKAYAQDYSVNNSGLYTSPSGRTPFTFGVSSSNFNLNIDDIWMGYGTLDYCSFDANISLGFNIANISNYLNFSCSGNLNCDIYAQYNDASGAAQQTLISNSSLGINLSSDSTSQVINFNIPVVLNGTPTGFKVVLSSSGTAFQVRNTLGTDQVLVNFDIYYNFNGSITNFSTNPQSSSGSANNSPIVKNSNPLGYSTLNLGVNGDLYFLRTGKVDKQNQWSSLIIPNQYLQPISFYFNDVNSHLNTAYKAALCIGMGDYPCTLGNTHGPTGSPIAVIGDTRPGDYCMTFGISTDAPLTQETLDRLTSKSMYVFEFNLGWTGNQFGLPSDATISYCYFQDTLSGLYYMNLYFFFTTDELFDSFILRYGPTIDTEGDIKELGFTLSKYTGTIQDQLNQSQEQWESDIPSHNSFTSAINGTGTAVSQMQNIETEAFDRLDSSMTSTGVNSFNLNQVSNQMGTVSGLINTVYAKLPSKLKFIITAVLIIGVFAVIIRSGAYASGKNGG